VMAFTADWRKERSRARALAEANGEGTASG
jgi:hypothetical protein